MPDTVSKLSPGVDSRNSSGVSCNLPCGAPFPWILTVCVTPLMESVNVTDVVCSPGRGKGMNCTPTKQLPPGARRLPLECKS